MTSDEIKSIVEKSVSDALGKLSVANERGVVSDPRLKDALTHYSEAYAETIEVVLTALQKQIQNFALANDIKAQYVSKGIELTSDLSLKLAITIEANKDNLLLKALDSTAQMIGMLGQGGLEIPKEQFDVYYQALKKVFDRAGVTLDVGRVIGKAQGEPIE